MKKFKIELTGITPIMTHKMGDAELFALLGAKQEKKKAIEELTPRQIAEKYTYKNEDNSFCIPTSYICGAFKSIASDYKQNSTGRKSMKTIAAGIFRPITEFTSLLDHNGKQIFDFEVDLKKATNHMKGAICICRPRFDKWKLVFEAMIDDSIVAPHLINEMLSDAGKRAGIGSFRVNRSGPYGQFSVTEFKELVE